MRWKYQPHLGVVTIRRANNQVLNEQRGKYTVMSFKILNIHFNLSWEDLE